MTFLGRGTTGLARGVPLLLCIVFAAALATRLAFVWVAPYAGGDWVLYSDVARNILAGCGVAVTGPAGCVPHFGGNQLPLFPAFVAAVWYVTGPSDVAVRIAQSIIASLSSAWLAFAVLRLTRSRVAAYVAGAAQAFSLVQAYWAGSLLTETLALASTQWVLAELLLSLAAGRFRIVPVGLAMVAATWARMDGILLLVPVVIAAFAIDGARQGLRAVLLAGLIVGTPLAAWAVRNIAVGISPLPSNSTLPDGTSGPAGYLAWANTWVVTSKQHADTGFFGPSHYERIKIAPEAYHDAAERVEVEALLARLRTVSGQAFPPDVDAAFGRLAEQRRATQTLAQRAQRDVARAWSLMARWIWPWTRYAGDGREGNSPTDFYRFAVMVVCVLTGCIGAFTGPRAVRFVAGMTALYLMTRVAFFAIIAGIEFRYMVELAPFIESTAAIGLVLFASGTGILGRQRFSLCSTSTLPCDGPSQRSKPNRPTSP